MSITRFAIEKNRITFVLLFLIVFAGISVYNSIPQQEAPDFVIRVAQVMTFLPGASPERIEKAVAFVLSDPRVEALIVNILGGITRCDDTAKGIIQARENTGTEKPIVVRMMGTNEERHWEPEIHRLKGVAFEAVSMMEHAGQSYREALEVAQEQQARILHLRATVCLAKMLKRRRRHEEAIDLLNEALLGLSESLAGQQDWQDAQALAEELGHS